jgi:alanine dehydrogenase
MLMISNDVVKQVLTMRECIEAQAAAFAGLLQGKAIFRPRIDTYVPCDREDGYYRWGTVDGASDGVLAVRLKSDIVTWPKSPDGTWAEHKYCVRPGTYCGLVFLFSTGNGEPLCIMNDGHLQQMRVGGAAGLGTRLLSREDSQTVGMLGSGGMARTFLEAIAQVRDIRKVKVYSRSAHNRKRYASEMSTELGIEVVPVDSPEEAARGADILSTCTDSMKPTIEPEWLEPGMHVVNLGLHEISMQTAARFDVSVQQGKERLEIPESETFRRDVGGSMGAYIMGTPEEQRRLPPAKKQPRVDDAPVYTDVISGKAPGRTSAEQITHYRTIGNWGVQFSAVGAVVYRRAKAAGLGHELPTEWFLQDIRN